MTQSIINIGNSAGIIIPKEVLTKLKITKGSEIDMQIQEDTLVISKKGIRKSTVSVSPELLSWLDGFNARYKKALEELAQK